MSAEVVISLDTHRSWVVTGKMNDYLLKHEQGHYDITALAAGEFYREVLKLNATNSAGIDTGIKKLNDELQKAINDANLRYDAQTDHSRDTQLQQTWDQRISGEKQKPDGKIINLP